MLTAFHHQEKCLLIAGLCTRHHSSRKSSTNGRISSIIVRVKTVEEKMVQWHSNILATPISATSTSILLAWICKQHWYHLLLQYQESAFAGHAIIEAFHLGVPVATSDWFDPLWRSVMRGFWMISNDKYETWILVPCAALIILHNSSAYCMDIVWCLNFANIIEIPDGDEGLVAIRTTPTQF